MTGIPQRLIALCGAFLLIVTALAGDIAAAAVPPVGAADDTPEDEYSYGVYSPNDGPAAGLFELSGLAPSNQEALDGVYWAVQDFHASEDRRLLYRMRYDAQQSGGPESGNGLVIDDIIPIDVPEDPTDDWEAVATDQAGNVYIGDIGAGSLGSPRTTERQVHMIAANDVKTWTTGALTPTRTWSYTPGTPSAAGLLGNAEAMFNIDNQVYLLGRGDNGRVAKLDPNGNTLTAVPGALSLYPTLSQVVGAEVSHDGHTMVALTRGSGFQLKSSYIYPRQDQAPLSPDAKAVKLLAHFDAEPNTEGVAGSFEHAADLEFEGVAFGDTGAVVIDGSSYHQRRQDDNAYALLVTDHATTGNNQVYRVPAQAFREGVECSVSRSKNGRADDTGDRALVSWDGFDSNDAYNGSSSIYVHRTIVDPTAGGWYYWQGNIGRNVRQLEQFVNNAAATKEVRYTLFPRQDLPGGLTNQDMFIAVPCGGLSLGDTLTCSTVWNAEGGIDVGWNHQDVPDRTYDIFRSVDGGVEERRVAGATQTLFVDTTPHRFSTVEFRVVALSGLTPVGSADCGTMFDPAGELTCSVASEGTTDRIVWDRFKGSDFPGFPGASLAKVKVFRQEVGTANWYQQGFFGVNTDTLYQDNRETSFSYRFEIWVDANGAQQPLPNLVTCA